MRDGESEKMGETQSRPYTYTTEAGGVFMSLSHATSFLIPVLFDVNISINST